ncbi:hypothetical protein ET495_00200 [Xylanimonas allomyrinae]|uniref:Uncharacterized protein n=1 Tax=Xylanimonas allomyrinae TaxID=2509459 RepID=A0A4V0YDV0_9MICO|nr:hypothetical protein [Xylanimonas allomyrinae]QAY61981.1 hypothetical protein ET495_00200 [Xylanimonas allomyrinae]
MSLILGLEAAADAATAIGVAGSVALTADTCRTASRSANASRAAAITGPAITETEQIVVNGTTGLPGLLMSEVAARNAFGG